MCKQLTIYFGFEKEFSWINRQIMCFWCNTDCSIKKSLLAHIKGEVLSGVQKGPLQNSECYTFLVRSIDICTFTVYTKDFNTMKTFNSAASLAAACWMISNQIQVRSMQHIACNPSNLFWSVTGERLRGGYQRVFGAAAHCWLAFILSWYW